MNISLETSTANVFILISALMISVVNFLTLGTSPTMNDGSFADVLEGDVGKVVNILFSAMIIFVYIAGAGRQESPKHEDENSS